MTSSTQPRLGLIQHKVRPEVKRWIQSEAAAQERSQSWFLTKLVENAYALAQQAQGAAK